MARNPLRIVSTDAGLDDALALILLHHCSPQPIDVIVATGGNVRAELVGNNCAFLAERFGFTARLFAGTDPPDTGESSDAAHVHGPYGLAHLQPPAVSLPPFAELRAELLASDADVELLVLGPATDAAALLRAGVPLTRPVLMGGAFGKRGGRLGNVTPFAEFNVYMEPGAAWSVMRAAPDCRFIPLDATENRLFGAAELLEGTSGPLGRLIADFVTYLRDAHVRLGIGDGVFMHDVLAAAIWADLISAEWRQALVREVVAAGPRRGMIVRRSGPAGAHPDACRVTYARRADEAAFLALWRRTCRAVCV